jgi:hypothetical protein
VQGQIVTPYFHRFFWDSIPDDDPDRLTEFLNLDNDEKPQKIIVVHAFNTHGNSGNAPRTSQKSPFP